MDLMKGAVQAFERAVVELTKGQKPNEIIGKREQLISFFDVVVKGREDALSETQRRMAEHIIQTLKKPNLTVCDLQEIIGKYTCIFKVWPSRFER